MIDKPKVGYRSAVCCSLCGKKESNNGVILHNSICGHRACQMCLIESSGIHGKGMTAHQYIDVEKQLLSAPSIYCPTCNKSYESTYWLNMVRERHRGIRTKRVRDRVFQVMNRTRSRYNTDEEYNVFMEEREELIAKILACEGREEQRQYELLRQAELLNQSSILENSSWIRDMNKAEVRDIVDKEGLFFEMCKSEALIDIQNTSSMGKLVHPLQRKYSDFFGESKMNVASLVLPSPAEGSVNYPDMKKQPFVQAKKYEIFRAGGYDLKILNDKLLSTLIGGIYFNKRDKVYSGELEMKGIANMKSKNIPDAKRMLL